MDEQSTDQAHSTSTEPTEPRRAGGTSLTWLLALPLFYILSIGPVAKVDESLGLSDKHPALGNCFGVIYAPMSWGAEHSFHFRRFMDWYFRLWRLKDA